MVYGNEIEEVSTLWPVLFAIVTTFMYSFRTIYVKIFVRNLKFNSFDYITHSYMLSGSIFLPFTVQNMYEHNFNWEIIGLGVSSGVLNGVATFLLFYATSTGVTGPAYALKNIEPIVQALYGHLFLGAYLNINQTFAIILGILGSLTMTLGPYIFKDMEEVEKEKRLIEKVKQRYSKIL